MKVIAPLVAFLALGASGATAADPWQLRCASMPAEQPLPGPLRQAALRFFPWVRPAARGLRSGPVYVVALSGRSAISRDGDGTDGRGFYLHRALVAIAPSYAGAVAISGHRLGAAGDRTVLGFSANGATRCSVSPPDVVCGSRPLRFAATLTVAPGTGWRIIPTELRIGRTGCFAIKAAGSRLHETVPLAVPGPDYGSSGW